MGSPLGAESTAAGLAFGLAGMNMVGKLSPLPSRRSPPALPLNKPLPHQAHMFRPPLAGSAGAPGERARVTMRQHSLLSAAVACLCLLAALDAAAAQQVAAPRRVVRRQLRGPLVSAACV